MLALGLDLGASSVKLALLENGRIKSLWMQTHQGRPFECLQNGLEMLNLHEKAAVCVTGANSEALLAACPELTGLGDIPAKFAAFGFHVIEVKDGNDMRQVLDALDQPAEAGKPTCMICHTTKGKGVSYMENQAGWHGKAPNEEQRAQALKELEA